MNLLTSPLFLRGSRGLVAGGFSFRDWNDFDSPHAPESVAETLPDDTPASPETLPLFTYQAVIQELKQQKHELQNMQSSERRRAKTSEKSVRRCWNLPCGVLFFTPNGLVRRQSCGAADLASIAGRHERGRDFP